ncbi:MAG: hypothetical protein C0462_13425 [Alcanivorax sp.]|nr:hypothetical protein [Alcanivorax sp.]
MKKLFACLLCVALLVGCSDPRLDASSEEAFEQSLEQVVEKMSEEEREAFAEALLIVMLHNITRDDMMAAQMDTPPEEMPSPFAGLDGMTVDEVHAQARQIRESARGER